MITTRNHTLTSAASGLLAALLAAVTASPAHGQAAGRVVAPDGRALAGTILATTPNDVEIEDSAGELRKVPIDRIADVQFDDEPPKVRTARSLLEAGRPADALGEIEEVEKSELEGVPALVITEMEFVKVAAAGLLAAQSGDGVAAADAAMAGFLAKNPRSHHAYELQQILADLRTRAGKFDGAAAAFDALAAGPPAFKVQAAAGKAGILHQQGKFAEAAQQFDAAIAIPATDEPSLARKRLATLGKARALARLDKPADALALLDGLVKQADPENKDLLARAYIVRGEIFGGMPNRQQDALIAFLTVDLVYNSVPEAHAEALFNLATLWQQARQDQRARDAEQTLKAAYPQSGWTKKLAGAGKAS